MSDLRNRIVTTEGVQCGAVPDRNYNVQLRKCIQNVGK